MKSILNHPATNDSPRVARNGTGTTETGGKRAPSRSLVWAISLGEAILWGALAWFFSEYWLMLPVRYRLGCVLVLVSLPAIGLFRLVRFYRRFPRVKKSGKETPEPERRSD